MVSAVSSQAATLNPLAAYAALDGDDSSQQPASNAPPNDSDRGPATQVSLSQDALDRLTAAFKQAPNAARQAIDAFERDVADHSALVEADMQAKREAAQREGEVAKINSQLTLLDLQDARQDTNTSSLKMLHDAYDKMQNSPITPAVQLTDAQIAEVLKKAKPLGYDPAKFSGADNYGFGMDGLLYSFKKDGTAWVNESGVATSVEQQQKSLASMTNMMAFIQSDMRDNGAARTDLIAQRDALLAQ
jgi:hypothetical protein